MKQVEGQGCLKPSYAPGPALWPLSGEGGCSEKGHKRDTISNKNHPRNTLYTQSIIKQNDHA